MPSYNTIEVILWDNPVTHSYLDSSCKGSVQWSRNFIGDPPSGSVRSYTPYSITQAKGPNHDPDSWKQIRKSGIIKMTDYHHGKCETFDSIGEIIHQVGTNYLWPFWGPSACPFCDTITGTQRGSYVEKGDLSYWKERFPTAPLYGIVIDDYSSRLEQAKTSLVAEASSSYDLLTEIAELKSTFLTLLSLLQRVTKPLTSFKEARDRILRSRKPAKETAKRLSDLWLEYQYGIMPIVNSVQDILEMYRTKGDKYQTVRSRFQPKVEFQNNNGEDVYFYQEGVYTLSVNLTGKSRYDSGSIQKLFNGISINPFLTAWELIPYSFVVDWFIGVGDFIVAMTSVITDISSERTFCYSVKESGTVNTYLHARVQYEKRFSMQAYNIDSINCHTPAFDSTFSSDESFDVLLRREVINKYSRTVFQPHEVKLVFNPFLNWERWLTSVALSVRPLIKGLRSLR